MKVELQQWLSDSGWVTNPTLTDANLVIYFAGKGLLESGERFEEIKSAYPFAEIVGCTTGGEIFNQDVYDDSISLSAIKFDKTKIKTASVKINRTIESFVKGEEIAHLLNAPDLINIFLLSDGIVVNGSEIVNGIYSVLNKNIILTGGLAGDMADFEKTLVGANKNPESNTIVAVGFYGDALKVGYGCVGGWDPFGPKRVITKSIGNVLYELDGKPALDLYKQYLGPEEAAKLPGSGLLFPLNIRPAHEAEESTVRTVKSIDENTKSLSFTGDIPQGYIAQLMHGDFNHLIDGAAEAAISSKNLINGEMTKSFHPEKSLALLVSCIGRKLLLGQQISDEVEAVSEAMQNKISMVGFYSYGEICHQEFSNKCGLHNQTMTITVITEE